MPDYGPLKTTVRQDSGTIVPLFGRAAPFEGVDLYTDPAALDPGYFARGENVDGSAGTLDRRRGARKIARLSNPSSVGASKTFGAVGKYATFVPPLVPYGGFGFGFHCVATRGLDDAYLISGNDGTDAHNMPVSVTLSTAGVLTVTVYWDGGGSTALATSALTDGLTVHAFLAYDPVAATLYLYVNGALAASTGSLSGKRPLQYSMTWYVAVLKTILVGISYPFLGAIDGLVLFTFRGVGDTAGLIASLVRQSARQWPAPQEDMVLAFFDMDDAATVMRDRSGRGNNGTVTGTPTVTAAVALLSAVTNLVTALETPGFTGNVVASHGDLFYQRTAGVA